MPSPLLRVAKKLISEFGEDAAPVVERVVRSLGADATEASVRKAVRQEGFKPLSQNPLAVQLRDAARAPRRRQKPVVRFIRPDPQNADPDKWLQRARSEAAERYSQYNRIPGKVTAAVRGRVELDPKKLANIPGARGERRVPGEYQYDRLRPVIEAEGFDPNTHIWLGINHLGEPYVAEGNTRLAVARDLGIERVPAEVMWYGGGEQVEGPMMPDLLQKYMPPSELSLDPNFRRWFEGSQMVDDYGEPMLLYHGTRGDVTAFDPARIGQSDFGASGRGFYFSQDPGTAGLYAEMARGIGDPNMLGVYLAARNPLELGAFLPRDVSESELLTQRAREAGHDAIIVRSPKDNTLNEVVVFKPTQIKSATGNRGTYDPNDPDIRKARGGLAVKKNPLSVRRK